MNVQTEFTKGAEPSVRMKIMHKVARPNCESRQRCGTMRMPEPSAAARDKRASALQRARGREATERRQEGGPEQAGNRLVKSRQEQQPAGARGENAQTAKTCSRRK